MTTADRQATHVAGQLATEVAILQFVVGVMVSVGWAALWWLATDHPTHLADPAITLANGWHFINVADLVAFALFALLFNLLIVVVMVRKVIPVLNKYQAQQQAQRECDALTEQILAATTLAERERLVALYQLRFPAGAPGTTLPVDQVLAKLKEVLGV